MDNSKHYYRTLSFPVSQSKNITLQERMLKNGIYEDDLEESFIHSSGPGGQNVNKTSTCVLLIHKNSGLRVKCSKTRRQGLNRYYARKQLCELIEEQILGEKSAASQKINKAIKQKDRRRRKASRKYNPSSNK